IIATDDGENHLERALPFLEAGVPLFIDKPLTDNAADLEQFIKWRARDAKFISCSCMRYAREFEPWHDPEKVREAVGELKLITLSMAKSWARYGIHALEAVY